MLRCSLDVDVVPLEIETVFAGNNDKDKAGSTKTEEGIEDFLPQCSAVIETIKTE